MYRIIRPGYFQIRPLDRLEQKEKENREQSQ